MNSLFEKLCAETSTRNWDTIDDAYPIPRHQWHDAYTVYMFTIEKSNARIFVAPCADGSIHLNFYDAQERNFLIEVQLNGKAWWSKSNDVNGRCYSGVTNLVESVKELLRWFEEKR